MIIHHTLNATLPAFIIGTLLSFGSTSTLADSWNVLAHQQEQAAKKTTLNAQALDFIGPTKQASNPHTWLILEHNATSLTKTPRAIAAIKPSIIIKQPYAASYLSFIRP